MKSRVAMISNIVKHALLQTYNNVVRNHILFMAAALSYYFVLSLFPTLILLSAIVAYFPISNLFNQAYPFMSRLLPSDSMGLIARVLADVLTSNRRAFLSLGILGTLWTSSSAFAATIEALNLAYNARDERPFWKTRLLAVGLAFTTGFSMVVAHSMMIVGPRFGEWIARRVDVSELFIILWHYLCLTIATSFVVLAIEILYYFAPSVSLRFRDILPGAVVAVVCWIGLSSLLGEYFRHFARFNKTYGTLGAAIALMVWLYWTGFAILMGACLNAELAKLARTTSRQEDDKPILPSD
jgi:membrane protein